MDQNTGPKDNQKGSTTRPDRDKSLRSSPARKFSQVPKRKVKSGRVRRHLPSADAVGTHGSLDPSLYVNRELSWLEFNHRVLEEALDLRHPLLERVKFLSIVSANLDEFFMIRVAAIKEQILADVVEYSPDGRIPLQQLKAIHERVSEMLARMSACFWDDLHPALEASGIHLLRMDQQGEADRKSLSQFFAREIFPVLTPLAFDPGHPFPYISNLSLNLALVVTDKNGVERFARVKVPDVLPRLIEIPGNNPDSTEARFVWLEDLIRENVGMLFPGMNVQESYIFRVTRNADIEIEEDEAGDLISSISESLRLRRYGSVVRVGMEEGMPSRIKDVLVENLEVTQDDVYDLKPPMGMSHLMQLMKLPRPDLKDPPFNPRLLMPDEEVDDIFSLIRRGDQVMHHPYDSFVPVVQFIKTAVQDPNVLAIKQTLYRIGKESPLIPLLIEAAESGKQVAVLVELKARFDEENNIIWARKLERAGVHVVYGLVGLKTHGKMALVIRKESDRLRRYVHLGTGNYNPVTARVYTDLSFLTCREDIAGDVSEVFNFLTGYSRHDSYKKLAVAPVNLRKRIMELIEREIDHARSGREAQMILKMNALTDVKTIRDLYEASGAGVKIALIVRGICSLRPGLKGVSENIRVMSIVGRFLEHSRVFYFANGGVPEIYISSADLMGRNLDRRVELMFPVEDPNLLQIIKRETLDIPLQDSLRARVLGSDGQYSRSSPTNGSESLDSQSILLQSRMLPPELKQAVPKEAVKKDTAD
jgi:polyphosphate kinase